MKLLVANRGEVAVRIVRAARERGVPVVAVAAADEAQAWHAAVADEAVVLPGEGAAAYQDAGALVRAAVGAGCTHVHPGYGFLSENAGFARACADAGLVFVGPSPRVLEVFGDKTAARRAAVAAGVPVLEATRGGASAEEVAAFVAAHPGGAIVKAVAAGGGLGMETARSPRDAVVAHAKCSQAAQVVYGNGDVFAEELLERARHIEVQVVGAADGPDGAVRVRALGDRDCSVQRRHQKLVEIAPAPALPDALRRDLHAAAVRVGADVGLTGLGTVEFLLSGERFVFLEVNPRLQVEHTVTEEVTGLDLVGLALDIADGAAFADLALPDGVTAATGGEAQGEPAPAHGTAVQCRVYAEWMDEFAQVWPAAPGTVTAFTPPTGTGVRVDTDLRPGTFVSMRYDPLLAKVIVHTRAPAPPRALTLAREALGDLVLDGVGSNRLLLRAILAEPDLAEGQVTTDWLTHTIRHLVKAADADPAAHHGNAAEDGGANGSAAASTAARPDPVLAPDEQAVRAPLLGTVTAVAAPGDEVGAGADLVVLEAMKMHHAVTADGPVVVGQVLCAVGDTVPAGTALLTVRQISAEAGESVDSLTVDATLDTIRPDLAAVLDRHARTRDDARTDRLAKLRARGRRTARENIADLVDPGSFTEFAPLALAAQRSRRSVDELIETTPADGLVGGTATVNGALFDHATDVVVMSYDYSVLAGTQGMVNHAKTDRLLDLAARRHLPVVLFPEGGGGRPGDSDRLTTGLLVPTFRALAELRGRVPLVAVVSGRCFAGNAAFAGTCDVIIATPDTNLGMGGPAMIEGGGLGIVRPEEIGPAEVQTSNGVIDILADDEPHAVALARRYLGYFQGRLHDWTAPDPRLARHAVPADRLRAYDVRAALAAIADTDSVLELRPTFGRGIVTALARFEGHPCAVIANDSTHLGGAIDAVSARKATEFLRLSHDFGLPLLSLCDTPGFMVGPAAEEDASVRRFAELFAVGAALDVPVGLVILRKGYGLGAMAMATGHFHAPRFTVAWPTGELGPMGLEGAVRLGFRRELDAQPDPAARQKLYEDLVAAAYDRGKAVNAATINEIDDVIDPAETRRWVGQLFQERN